MEDFAEYLWSSNPLMLDAQRGLLGSETQARYLVNLHHFFGQTPGHLGRAQARALNEGLPVLADYYEQKRLEEEGHSRWAADDLRRLGNDRPGVMKTIEIVPSMHKLVAYAEALIDEDPRSYLALTFLHEYLTVFLGPRWIAALTTCCNADVRSLSSVTKHIELDAAHADRGVVEMDTLINQQGQWARLERALEQTMKFVDTWLSEVRLSHPIR